MCSRTTCAFSTLKFSAAATTEAEACTASLEAAARYIAALVTSFSLSAYPPAHGPSFQLALRLALRSMRALATLTLSAFDADLLAVVPPTLTRLTLQADTLPFAFLDWFLAERPQMVHLAFPNFVGLPLGACSVPATAVPHLVRLAASAGLTAVLAPGRPVRRVTLRVASTMACARWRFLMCWGTS
jgi:hypothetical protein